MAASRPRLSETEPKCFVFETSMRSVGYIALSPSLRKRKREQCLSQELKKVRHMSHQAKKGETYVSPS